MITTTTKTAAAIIAATAVIMSLLGAVTPAAFAQDGSLVSFNQNIQTPTQVCPAIGSESSVFCTISGPPTRPE
jgi:hypothetical protein